MTLNGAILYDLFLKHFNAKSETQQVKDIIRRGRYSHNLLSVRSTSTYSVPFLRPAVVIDLDVVLVLYNDLGHYEHVRRVLGVDVATLSEVLLGVVGFKLLLLLLERHRFKSGNLLGLAGCLLRCFVVHLAAGVINRRQTARQVSELHVSICLARGTRCYASLLVHRIVRAMDLLGRWDSTLQIFYSSRIGADIIFTGIRLNIFGLALGSPRLLSLLACRLLGTCASLILGC